jgi:hypothetical protein
MELDGIRVTVLRDAWEEQGPRDHGTRIDRYPERVPHREEGLDVLGEEIVVGRYRAPAEPEDLPRVVDLEIVVGPVGGVNV